MDFNTEDKKERKPRSAKYRIIPASWLKGRGYVNIEKYGFPGKRLMFPGGEIVLELSNETYLKMRQDKSLRLQKV